MTVVRSDQAVHYATHGSTFSSYVAPSRGSVELCAWRLIIPPGVQGASHRPTREEVLLVLEGEPTIALDGTEFKLHPGDVVVVPAGGEFRVDGGASVTTAWVTTTPGLEAVMADGARISPPWAR